MTAGVLSQLRVGGGGGFAVDEARWGIYHLTAGGETTWFDFAAAILERLGGAGARGRLVPIGSDAWAGAAVRPRYSVLDNGRLWRAFGLALPAWDEQFALVASEIAALEVGVPGGVSASAPSAPPSPVPRPPAGLYPGAAPLRPPVPALPA